MLDINQLSEAELRSALKAKQNQSKDERKAYKELVNEMVPDVVKGIKHASTALSIAKENVFKAFEACVKLKFELFEVKETQQTHTFSDDAGNSITIGYNVIDGWDDTVNSGIAKIEEYIKSLASKNTDSETMTIINRLLKRDPKGNLKSSRVLELSSLAEEINNNLLTDGVRIIKEAYKPVRTSFFCEANEKDEAGNKVNIPLNISSVPFPEGFDYSFLFPTKDE